MTLFPAQQPDQGATNMPNPNPSATEDGRAVSGDLSPETVAVLVDLARALDPEACDPPAKTLPIGDAAEVWRRQDAALLTARRVWEAGWRPAPPRPSGGLVAEEAMAKVMDPNAHDDGFPMDPDRRVERLDAALAHAIAAVEAGFQLVSEDDTTVDRLAVAMHAAGCGCGMSLDEHQASMRNDFDEEDPAYAVAARAAVRALREAGQ